VSSPSVLLLYGAITANGDLLIAILQHVETVLETGGWSLVGWWKASSTTVDDGSTLVTPKCHVVVLNASTQQSIRLVFDLFNL